MNVAVSLLAAAAAVLAAVSSASALPAGRSGTAHGSEFAVTIPPAPAFAPLELANAAGPDWPTNGGDYGQTRYTTLNEITTAKVGKLKLAWHIHLNGSGVGTRFKGEGTPLVYKGIMYTVTGAGDVFAIDAKTGTVLWESGAQLPSTMHTVCCGWAHRGLALGDGKVYLARLDSSLVALSQQDGSVVWTASNGRWEDGYTMTMAPLYFNGLVIVGVSGGEYGARGSVTAYDARDGHRVWRFYTVPAPGDFGSGTWPPGQEWTTGGATVWNTPSVDAKSRVLYFTTGNAYPWSTRGPGDNLFTSSFVALNAMNGNYAWHYQVVHHDIWDYDCPSNTVLFRAAIGGTLRKIVAEPCKTGWVYELDRKSGSPVTEIDEKPVPQSVFQHTSPTQPIPVGDNFANQCAESSAFPKVAPDGGRFRFGCIFTPFDAGGFTAVAPGVEGGSNWNPASYSPKTGNLYVCSRNSQYAYRAIPSASGVYSGGRLWVGAELAPPESKAITTGAFTALRMTTNKIVWRRRYAKTFHHQSDASCGSGSVVTAGGLVFMGLPEGMYHGIVAYNASTGARLWRFHTDAGIEAPPISYGVEGRQYIAVYAGGRETAARSSPKGDSVYAFTLGGG
jgi:quinohemoprotein ethanol dehydrogenase